MFGMGFSEIVVILVVALIFLGPEKLPEAAKSISKGIRDLRKQSRDLQVQIESDEHIGGAIRDLRSALRGEEPRGYAPAAPEATPAPCSAWNTTSPIATCTLSDAPLPYIGMNTRASVCAKAFCVTP